MSHPTTPLLSLDAAVLDTETTSLDTRRARIVQLGAVLIQKGKLDGGGGFQSLVNPGESIPPASTAIHGIADDTVSNAPGFTAVIPKLSAFIGERLVIGFALDFDMAVLKREFAIANRHAWAALYDFRLPDDVEPPAHYREKVTAIMTVVEREVAAVLPVKRRKEAPELARSLLATVHGHCFFTLNGTFRILHEAEPLAAARARVADALAKYR